MGNGMIEDVGWQTMAKDTCNKNGWVSDGTMQAGGRVGNKKSGLASASTDHMNE